MQPCGVNSILPTGLHLHPAVVWHSGREQITIILLLRCLALSCGADDDQQR